MRQAEVSSADGELLATLAYGHAATLWRMNLGWRRRKDKDQTGYVLDIERGYWARILVEDPTALPAVARLALEIAHFDPDTGADEHRAKGAREDCEAACYDCLLSYFDQRDHRFLDVTTTTQPPRELAKEPWLRLTLDGAPAERRLLRRDL